MVLPTQPSTAPECTCSHSIDCNCGCHGRHCDPTEHSCSIEFLPDEGGLTQWGCAQCTPGFGIGHDSGCAVLVVDSPPAAVIDSSPPARAGWPISADAGGSAPSSR